MALFRRKENVLGEITFFMYPNGEMVMHDTILDTWFMIIGYACFLGKIVSDLGEQKGTMLWKSLFRYATSALEIIRKKDGLPIDKKMLNITTPFRVVQSFLISHSCKCCGELKMPPYHNSIGSYLKETGKIICGNKMWFCERSSTAVSYPNSDDTVIGGFESAFTHLFNFGERHLKYYLPIVIIQQSNWYQENGLPPIAKIYDAPMHAINFMFSDVTAGSQGLDRLLSEGYEENRSIDISNELLGQEHLFDFNCKRGSRVRRSTKVDPQHTIPCIKCGLPHRLNLV